MVNTVVWDLPLHSWFVGWASYHDAAIWLLLSALRTPGPCFTDTQRWFSAVLTKHLYVAWT